MQADHEGRILKRPALPLRQQRVVTDAQVIVKMDDIERILLQEFEHLKASTKNFDVVSEPRRPFTSERHLHTPGDGDGVRGNPNAWHNIQVYNV